MINDARILDLQKTNPSFILPFDADYLQGHSYDCRLDQIVQMPVMTKTSSGFKKSWEKLNISSTGFHINKGEFILASTLEYFNLPDTIAGYVSGKSSIGRNGLQVENAGFVDAGFSGNITLEFYNMCPWPVLIRAGMPICQIIFHEVEEAKIKPYRTVGHYNKQVGPTVAKYEI